MCTVIVGFDPEARTPLVVAALRDEMRSRPWDWPARHWPQRPNLVGGRDSLAGGTWLAVDSGRERMAALLNGWPWDGSMPWEGTYPASRGDLPLKTLAPRAVMFWPTRTPPATRRSTSWTPTRTAPPCAAGTGDVWTHEPFPEA